MIINVLSVCTLHVQGVRDFGTFLSMRLVELFKGSNTARTSLKKQKKC